jgi:hypothetical protein
MVEQIPLQSVGTTTKISITDMAAATANKVIDDFLRLILSIIK